MRASSCSARHLPSSGSRSRCACRHSRFSTHSDGVLEMGRKGSVSRVSLSQYLVEQERAGRQVPPELGLLIEVVARACKAISAAVSKGALGGVLGGAGTDNVQGESQKKL